MAFNGLLWLMLACAVVDWAASWRGWEKVRWVTKPGTLALLIAWYFQMGGWHGPLVWFAIGLAFSLLGDVFLQLPGNFFIFGMLAFLLAHLGYIIGFNNLPLGLDWRMVIPLALILVVDLMLFRRIVAGLRRQGEKGLVYPVLAYSVVLSAMFFFATTTLFRPGKNINAAMLLSLGAGLFFLSDSLLAYNRFVRPLPVGNLLVMVTYHLGQILIAVGALEQFL